MAVNGMRIVFAQCQFAKIQFKHTFGNLLNGRKISIIMNGEFRFEVKYNRYIYMYLRTSTQLV